MQSQFYLFMSSLNWTVKKSHWRCYNTPHSATGFPPAYLKFGKLPYNPPLLQNNYPPINEALKIAKQRTMEYHNKNKIIYDQNYQESKFNVGDVVQHKEFSILMHNTVFNDPYKILNKLSDVNFKLDKLNLITKQKKVVIHVSCIQIMTISLTWQA